MKTCYVSMPLGDADLDRLYFEVIKPAVERAGFSCVRSDELPPSVVLQRSIFSAVLQSDAMIADVSTNDPSVLYELGVRHALKRGLTLLLLRRGSQRPSGISHSPAIFYDLDAEGRVMAAEELQHRILSKLRHSGPMTTDSPLFQFFPDLRIDLPEPAATRSVRGRPRLPGDRTRGEGARTRSALPLSFEVKEAPDDPLGFLKTLKTRRDASDWDGLIREALEAPSELSSAPEVIHMLTLALNRRGDAGDQERAIELLEKTVDETGGDAETLGILGKISKERYAAHGDRQDLDRAIHAFRKAFELQADDFYVGVNLVSLLHETVIRTGDASMREELKAVLPRVRAAVAEKLKTGLPDYWEISAGLQLACLAHDWRAAEQLAELALSAAPSAWMIESSLRELDGITELLEAPDQRNLRKIIETLRQKVSEMRAEEVPYA